MSIADIIQIIMRGLPTTVSLLVVSTALAFAVAFVAGISRVSRFKFVRVGTLIYVEFFRGTSLLIQLFWLYYVLPEAFGVRLDPFLAGVVTLGLNYGAYGSEIVRSAILSVPKGQTEAGIALNMTRNQQMFRIILPQAFRTMIPGLTNNSIELLKGTSLVALIALQDMMYWGQNLRSEDFSVALPVFVILLLMYFLVALPLILLSKYFEKRASRGVAST